MEVYVEGIDGRPESEKLDCVQCGGIEASSANTLGKAIL